MPPTPPWLPAPLTLACSPDCRSPEALRQTLAQFDVEHDERYQRDSFGCKGTRCNTFCTDATRALEAEIPHAVDSCGRSVRTGTPGSHELSAAGMIGWLRVYGSEEGWQPVSAPEARALANQGRPVVAAWENPHPGQSSHVAMLLPTPEGMAEPRICQAGAANLWDRPLSHGFGNARPCFFAHD